MKQSTHKRFVMAYLLTCFLCIMLNPLFSQTTIQGKCTDKNSGAALSDANIMVKNTYSGTVSRIDGAFSLTVKMKPPFTVVVSYVGYRSEEIQILDEDVRLDVQLEETFIGSNQVIVTALRRDQQLMTVPAAISVLNTDFIEQTSVLNDFGDLALLTPGVTGFQRSSAQLYTIRGIGSDAYGVGSESSVGIFLDELYVGRVLGAVSLLDMERIEIIKGPQSTLFGRNSSAGAISYVSKKPANRKEASVQLGLGNEGQWSADYVLNLPLSDNLFFRFAGKYSYRNGLRTVTNLDDHQLSKTNLLANRASLLFKAPKNWTFQLSLEHQRSNINGWDYFSVNTGLGSSGDPYDRKIELNVENVDNLETVIARLNINKVLSDNLFIKSLTGFRRYDTAFFTDADATPLDIFKFSSPENAGYFTQEIRLTGDHEKVNWLIGGGFYWDNIENNISLIYDDANIVGGIPIPEDGLGFQHPAFEICDETSEILLGPCLNGVQEDNHNKGEYFSYSIFGDVTYEINPYFNISAGLRLSVDDKHFSANLPPAGGITQLILGDNLLGPNTGEAYTEMQRTFTGFQPRIAVAYTLQNSLTVYANYARGFKAGGFNNVSAIPFDSETSDAFEIGIKSTFLSERIKLNAALYFIDYNDLQVQTIGDGSGLLVIDNAAEVESKGVELETSVYFGKGFTMAGNAAIGRARYENYLVGESDFSGNTPARSPDQNFSLIGQFGRQIKNFGRLKCRVDYGYQTKIFFSRDNSDALSQRGYGSLNANVGIENLLNTNLEITIFGNNLLNEEFIIQAEDPFGTGPAVLRSVPRLIGVKVGYQFFGDPD